MDDFTRARGKKIAAETYPRSAHGPANTLTDKLREAFLAGYEAHAHSLEQQYIAAAEQMVHSTGVSPREAYELLAKLGLTDLSDLLRQRNQRIAELEAQLEGKNDG